MKYEDFVTIVIITYKNIHNFNNYHLYLYILLLEYSQIFLVNSGVQLKSGKVKLKKITLTNGFHNSYYDKSADFNQI